MPGTPQWCFGPFRLDPTTATLWRDDVLLPLPPKPFAVLAYLVAHAGQVVAKETLLAAVWPDTAVTEGVLKTCLGQSRQVLGERARTPQYIATLHRRGYRFVAAVTAEPHPETAVGAELTGAVGGHEACPSTPPHNLPMQPMVFIGRDTEVAEIRDLLVHEPDCRLLTLVGPGGIGKTRVALRVAETLLATQATHGVFAQGIFFVPLETVRAASGAEHVIRICRLVDGTPLALEIAAAWLKGLPCSHIAGELQHGLDILTARQQDLPVRHRSMRTILKQSWHLLTPEEQDVLTRLTVFQGGFTQEAARVVAGVSPITLTRLVETSMVCMTTPGRYQMHTLLRQFATAHLQAAWSIHDAYSQSVATLAQQRHAWFLDQRYAEAIQALAADREDLQAAWQWLMAQLQAEPTALQCASV